MTDCTDAFRDLQEAANRVAEWREKYRVFAHYEIIPSGIILRATHRSVSLVKTIPWFELGSSRFANAATFLSTEGRALHDLGLPPLPPDERTTP